ncbi:nicotinate phosphoribosyltransferase [Sporodiniella umbellata]|nr:nicotinate phosphoribosyltransferase [Sporodiniella umbellata]
MPRYELFKMQSILDNDVYKFTMQQAIFKYYPEPIPVVYEFTNRRPEQKLNVAAIEWLKREIEGLSALVLSEKEARFLESLGYFDKAYIEYLSRHRFRPSAQTSALELKIQGQWLETILYEVPLLALVSEAYYRHVDLDWDRAGQEELAESKAEQLASEGCQFLEFGTRRRRDFEAQATVVRRLRAMNGGGGTFVGTCNLHLARIYEVKPVGTVAHEFFMAVSALSGLTSANREALKVWRTVYPNQLGIALTDTFTTDVFLRDFDRTLAMDYEGVRQDSGDPFAFAERMVKHYRSLGIQPDSKRIVFSDGLDVALAVRLQHHAEGLGIGCSFGIGTFFTNDFPKKSRPEHKSQSLSIVIKLRECNGKRVVKLSDDPSKHSADKETIQAVQKELGMPVEKKM